MLINASILKMRNDLSDDLKSILIQLKSQLILLSLEWQVYCLNLEQMISLLSDKRATNRSACLINIQFLRLVSGGFRFVV